MKHHPARRAAAIGAVAVAAALSMAACGSDNNSSPDSGAGSTGGKSSISCAKGSITASGSSAQKNAVDEWVADYQSACSGSTINYQPVGSGAGIQAFTQGQTAFAGSDSALKDGAEQTAADSRCGAGGKAINLPMVTGPIAVGYKLNGVDKLALTPSAIAGIFSGTITKWDDPKIKSSNPDVRLPSSAIQAFHRSDSSGTTDNFTKYLAAAAGGSWTAPPGKEWTSPGGQGAKGSDGVAQAVKSTEGAAGYMEQSFAENADISVARIDNGADPVELTAGNVSKAVAAAQVVGTGNDVKLKLDYATKAAGAYPLVLVTYEITCEKGLSPDSLRLTKSFLAYAAGAGGQGKLQELGYAPLPDAIATKVRAAVNALS